MEAFVLDATLLRGVYMGKSILVHHIPYHRDYPMIYPNASVNQVITGIQAYHSPFVNFANRIIFALEVE